MLPSKHSLFPDGLDKTSASLMEDKGLSFFNDYFVTVFAVLNGTDMFNDMFN